LLHQPQDSKENNWNQITTYSPNPEASSAKTLTRDQKKILGLCFKCNEKFYAGHKCTGPRVHTMLGIENIELSDLEITDETLLHESPNSKIVHSLHSNVSDPESHHCTTMKFRGNIEKKKILFWPY
jgi:hypothetical protein